VALNGVAEVYVGKKAVMNYVSACLTLFHNGAKEVVIKARGKSISKAVDVVRILRENFIRNIKIENIEIGTEIIAGRNGKPLSLSTISIRLTREGSV